MKESEMAEIAQLMKKALIDSKNVKEEVMGLKKQFNEIEYCFKEDQI